MRQEAIRAFKKAVSYSGRGSMYMAELAYAYAAEGMRAEATKLWRELTERATTDMCQPTHLFWSTQGWETKIRHSRGWTKPTRSGLAHCRS